MLSWGYRQVGGNVCLKLQCRWLHVGGGGQGVELEIRRGRCGESVT